MTTQLQVHTVSFHGQSLITIKQNQTEFVAMRPVVEGIGLAWGAQSVKLNRQKEKFGCFVIETPSNGGMQEMLCIPLKKLNGWLFTINPEKVRPEIRETVVRYQEECFHALHDYWQQKPRFQTQEATRPSLSRTLKDGRESGTVRLSFPEEVWKQFRQEAKLFNRTFTQHLEEILVSRYKLPLLERDNPPAPPLHIHYSTWTQKRFNYPATMLFHDRQQSIPTYWQSQKGTLTFPLNELQGLRTCPVADLLRQLEAGGHNVEACQVVNEARRFYLEGVWERWKDFRQTDFDTGLKLLSKA